jgi:mannose-6-phosphate isomerase-like protein (cupin superfamily)
MNRHRRSPHPYRADHPPQHRPVTAEGAGWPLDQVRATGGARRGLAEGLAGSRGGLSRVAAVTYVRDAGEVSAEFHARDDVESLTFRTSGTHVRFVAPAAATRGQFGLFEWNMQPRTGGAEAHFHRTFSESFFVTSGTVEFYDGNRWVLARAGDFLYVPMGGVHGFRALSDEPSSMLILFAPGAPREKYFRELAAIRDDGRTLTENQWTEFLAEHDQYRAE